MARDRTYKPIINAKKHLVLQDEIDTTREEAKDASALLNNKYFKNYLQNRKASILEIHAKQLENDRQEQTTNNGVIKTVFVPSKKEYTLLAGEYRFVDGFLKDIELTIQIANEMEEKIKNEEILIKEEDTE